MRGARGTVLLCHSHIDSGSFGRLRLSTFGAGEIRVEGSSPGLTGATTVVTAEPVTPRPAL